MVLSSHPKIELHCHLDASVRIDTAREIAGEMGLGLPEPLERTLVAPDVCLDLADYIGRLDTALAVMQRPGDRSTRTLSSIPVPHRETVP